MLRLPEDGCRTIPTPDVARGIRPRSLLLTAQSPLKGSPSQMSANIGKTKVATE